MSGPSFPAPEGPSFFAPFVGQIAADIDPAAAIKRHLDTLPGGEHAERIRARLAELSREYSEMRAQVAAYKRALSAERGTPAKRGRMIRYIADSRGEAKRIQVEMQSQLNRWATIALIGALPDIPGAERIKPAFAVDLQPL